jgi:hypothetical protein
MLAASACGAVRTLDIPDSGVPMAPFDTGTNPPGDAGAPDSGTPNGDGETDWDTSYDAGADSAYDAGMDAGMDAAIDAGTDGGYDAGTGTDASDSGFADAGPIWVDTLESNRNRLLGTYFDFLKAYATDPQSNGLSGKNVSTVCDVWSGLAPSPRGVFLTLTARLQGSRLGIDGSSMLWHVVTVYRVAGGQGATPTNPGSCGGGEYNRMIMSQDGTLHDALLAANQHKGALQPDKKYDIADAPSGTSWRDSQDLGGPHTPFDLSDETEKGAPRGQTQYFSDPASELAKKPLGREDLSTLVDPFALELDLDYDCVHNSNPLCSYIFYGPLCAPQANKLGTDIYVQSYGSVDADFKPAGCP